MKICVYGAGSIGCYVGGRLLAAGSDLTFIGRARIGDELRSNGLTLSDYHGDTWRNESAAIQYSADASAAADADLILVTVKSAATQAAAAELAAVLKPDALVISLQNGLGNADILQAALPQHTVLAGMVPFNVMNRAANAFHQGTAGALEVAAHERLAPLLADFANAGLPLTQQAKMLPVQWAKLLLNLNNAINALSNLPLKSELSQRDYRRCLALAQAEALELLDEVGIKPAKLTPLPAHLIPKLLGIPDTLFRILGSKMLTIDPLARSSMSDDLAAQRTTEIDWINGEVVRLAERLGRDAPVNKRLCELVHDAESAATRPSWSGRALLAELRGVV